MNHSDKSLAAPVGLPSGWAERGWPSINVYFERLPSNVYQFDPDYAVKSRVRHRGVSMRCMTGWIGGGLLALVLVVSPVICCADGGEGAKGAQVEALLLQMAKLRSAMQGVKDLDELEKEGMSAI